VSQVPDNYYLNRRSEVAAFVPPGFRRALEMGCGGGEFRLNFGPDCEYWGIEPTAAAAATATQRLDRVLHGRFDEVAAQLPARYFDLIVCNDVLEHMVDPEDFLVRIRQYAAPDAVLVGSVPNVRFIANLFELLVRRDWEYKEEGILDRTHLRFFTEKSLRRFLTQHGDELEAFEGINPAVVSPPSAKFLVKRALIRLAGTDTRFPQFAFRLRIRQP